MVERLRAQMAAMEEWKDKEQKTLRRVFQWLGLAQVLFLVAVGIGFWQLDNLVEQNAEESRIHAQTAQQVVQASFETDHLSWEACNDRNQRSRAAEASLKKLVAAHTKDGNVNAAATWRLYLNQTRKNKLPDCGPEPQFPPPNVNKTGG